MSMKKTDLYKALAKKVGGQQKAERTPERFGKAAKATPVEEPKAPAAPKPVQVTLRLPPALVAQLREQALNHEDGISGVVTDALQKHFKPSRTRKKADSEA
jgi:hypothetical protein